MKDTGLTIREIAKEPIFTNNVRKKKQKKLSLD